MLFTLTSKIINYMTPKINNKKVVWELFIFPIVCGLMWYLDFQSLVVWTIVFKLGLINAYQTPENFIKK